ncbi:glycosyltransferase [Ciceribacter sp. sgz301302]
MVSSLVPVDTPASGFDIANRAVLDGLTALGHRVTVVGYLQPGQRPAPGADMRLLGEREVTNARVGAATKLAWLARAFARRTTLSSAKLIDLPAARIAAILDSLAPFDGLVLNSIQLPAAYQEVFRRYPSVYVAHNIEARSALENAARAENPLTRALFRREARHLDRLERLISGEARHVFTFAEDDRQGFGKTVARRASVLPLVTRWTPPAENPATAPARDLGLIGTWSWEPNRIGLDWFVEKVVPLLPADMTIAVAGGLSAPPATAHPGLRFVGRVADARAFIAQSAVVPLVARGGTGVQLKSIEAFEMGMPCVATRPSLRGIAAVPADCRIVDDPEGFAAALVESVATARGTGFRRDSGAAFHAAQKAELLAALEAGIAPLGRSVPAAARRAGDRPRLAAARLSGEGAGR